MKTILYFIAFVLPVIGISQTGSYGVKMANTVMANRNDSAMNKWTYDEGVILKGIEGLWLATSDAKYFKFIQHSMDRFIGEDGSIRTYKTEDYNLDNVLCGRLLLTLYKVTEKEKYYKAAQTLRFQLLHQPRTSMGGFWHKKRYPSQMWLDGLYMAEPFYAEWAARYKEDTAFNDIARQFILMEQAARDKKTGLLYHGYDESKHEKWADPKTGTSPNFWARAMGWYGMALVDVLEYFPDKNPKKKELVAILTRYAEAIKKVQDSKSGLWWDIVNYPGRKGNYEESSASSMFVYTLAKGSRLGYLPESDAEAAKKGYDGIVKKFIKTNSDNHVNLEGTVSVSGLGGDPYRDGSYDYYVNEKVVTNDPKGIGAFLLASNEIDMMQTLKTGRGKTVVLDSWFNNEHKKDAAGIMQQFHYKWDDESNGGFSVWGHLFNAYGVRTETLIGAPSAANLKNASIYIIVDPDNEKEVPVPHFIEKKDIDIIYKYVMDGGILVMMANDSANVELPHFNNLAHRFGIHWSDSSRNMVKDNKLEMGAIHISPGNQVFPSVKKVYLKEICLINVHSPAKAALTEDGDVIIAVAKVGKGTVFAVGDPWLYNEYTDGRKIPSEYQNAEAGRDLIKWLLKQ